MKKLMKILIKLDLLVYVLLSLLLFFSGVIMISGSKFMEPHEPQFSLGLTIGGGFVLFIGIASCIATYFKIKNTKFDDY